MVLDGAICAPPRHLPPAGSSGAAHTRHCSGVCGSLGCTNGAWMVPALSGGDRVSKSRVLRGFPAGCAQQAGGACAQAKGVPLASNQVQYSLLYRAPERNGVADALREAGATLIAYSPLAQGLLTGARPLAGQRAGAPPRHPPALPCTRALNRPHASSALVHFMPFPQSCFLNPENARSSNRPCSVAVPRWDVAAVPGDSSGLPGRAPAAQASTARATCRAARAR